MNTNTLQENKTFKKAFQYEFYPDNEQKELLKKTFGCVRFVYNQNLNIIKTKYEEYVKNKKLFKNEQLKEKPVPPSVSHFSLSANITKIKADKEMQWLREVPSVALQQTSVDLNRAFSKFFKGGSRYPKFKVKNNKQSFRLVGLSFRVNLENGTFEIQKCKSPFNLNYNRKLPSAPSSVTIGLLPCGKYIASFLCDVSADKTSGVGKVGIDLGIKDFAVLSDGTRITNEKHRAKAQKKLRRAQQALARKQKGSNNRNKARIKVAKLHYHVAQQRKDFQHKLSRKLINENQVICLESLRPANMIKNRKLSKHIGDVSWSSFKNMLAYKAKMSQHCNLVFVDPFYPSTHICNATGLKLDYKLKLSDRSWKCPHCNEIHDRDLNAAKNIRDEGLYRLAMHDPKDELKGSCIITSNE